MDNKKIQSLLEDAIEDKIPSSSIQLWPNIKADLAARKNPQSKKGNLMNTSRTKQIPRFSLAIGLVLVMVLVLFATPQGQAFAQRLLAFFNPADSTSFELENSPIVLAEPDAQAPTAAPPAPLISAAEAEAQAGFALAELSFVPEGLEYLGARMYGSHVTLEYQTANLAGHLIITQSQEGFYQSEWDSVPADAVVPVKIGELEGEFVQGTFVIYAGETNATWNPDAPIMKLRWQENGISYEIYRSGYAEAIEYIDMTEMIKFAEDLAD